MLGKRITDAEANRQMRQRVAYVAEDKPLYGYMTVEQTINFARSFYSDWRIDVEKKLLLDFELPANRKVKSLSKGMRTKLALSRDAVRNAFSVLSLSALGRLTAAGRTGPLRRCGGYSSRHGHGRKVQDMVAGARDPPRRLQWHALG